VRPHRAWKADRGDVFMPKEILWNGAGIAWLPEEPDAAPHPDPVNFRDLNP
jgi:hypothetical protein